MSKMIQRIKPSGGNCLVFNQVLFSRQKLAISLFGVPCATKGLSKWLILNKYSSCEQIQHFYERLWISQPILLFWAIGQLCRGRIESGRPKPRPMPNNLATSPGALGSFLIKVIKNRLNHLPFQPQSLNYKYLVCDACSCNVAVV